MSTSSAPAATPAMSTGTSVGTKVKNFFSAIGRDLVKAGNETLKIIGLAEKEIPAITPELNAALAVIYPRAVIPAETVEKIAQAGLGAAGTVATALQSAGLNPTLDEAAAVAVAGVIHSTGTTATAAVAATLTAPSSPPS